MAREMKDSGVEWIGVVPEEWGVQKVKNQFTRKKSIPQIDDYKILKLARSGIQVRDISSGEGQIAADYSKYNPVEPMDILINPMDLISGDNSNISKVSGVISQAYVNLRFRETANPYYYNYYFKLQYWLGAFFTHGKGVSFDNRWTINDETLQNFPVLVPSLIEQRKIVEFLDKKTQMIDDIITDTKQSIVELKAYKQSIITEAVTKGLDPNVEMKDSGVKIIGKIPAEWNVIKLGFLGSLQNGISKSSEYFGSGFPFVSYGDVYNNRQLISSVNGLVNSSAEDRINYSVKKGDIFFTRTSETIREVGMTSVCLTDIPDATFAGFLIRFRPTTDVLLTEFAEYYFQANFLRDFFAKEMNLVIRASLSQPLLKRVPVLLPDIREQRNIVNFINKKTSEIDELLSDKEQLISEYESYKKSLIYEYVTGKKQVK